MHSRRARALVNKMAAYLLLAQKIDGQVGRNRAVARGLASVGPLLRPRGVGVAYRAEESWQDRHFGDHHV